MKKDKLIEQFYEAKDNIPFDGLRIRKDRNATLYGDVIEWCRDYFNEPKNMVLAYMLVGYYYTLKEVEQNAQDSLSR